MKHLVLSLTCHGEVIRYLLLKSEAFRERYTCTFVPNYTVVDGTSQIASPEELRHLLPACDLLVYHPIVGYDFDALLGLLPAGAEALRIPYVTSTIYWPSYDFRHPIWLAPYASTALIPWPCLLLNKMIVTFRDKARIIREYLDLDIPSVMDIEANFAHQMDYLCQAEAGTIFTAASYVRENFRQRRLFHLINHPSIILFRHLTNCLLLHLGLPPLDVTPDDPFQNHQMPVHPSIRRYYRLDWGAAETGANLFERDVDYEQYVSIYVDEYIKRFQFQPFPVPHKRSRSNRLARAFRAFFGRRA